MGKEIHNNSIYSGGYMADVLTSCTSNVDKKENKIKHRNGRRGWQSGWYVNNYLAISKHVAK